MRILFELGFAFGWYFCCCSLSAGRTYGMSNVMYASMHACRHPSMHAQISIWIWPFLSISRPFFLDLVPYGKASSGSRTKW